jgi:hypothetical protein
MSRIVERVPMLLSAATLLTGAIVFGAAATYTYNESVVYAACNVACDAEDPDDCDPSCPCNDPIMFCLK